MVIVSTMDVLSLRHSEGRPCKLGWPAQTTNTTDLAYMSQKYKDMRIIAKSTKRDYGDPTHSSALDTITRP